MLVTGKQFLLLKKSVHIIQANSYFSLRGYILGLKCILGGPTLWQRHMFFQKAPSLDPLMISTTLESKGKFRIIENLK